MEGIRVRMRKDSYLMLMNWLKTHNIKRISYDLFIQFKMEQINYQELFIFLDSSNNFSLHQVDNLIKNNNKVMEIYKENIIFQYVYLILSPYKFSNKATLIKAFDTIHGFILEQQYEQIDTFLNSLYENTVNTKELSSIIKKINSFINSKEYIACIDRILNFKEELGNLQHSNILETQAVITATLKMLFVHKGDVDLDTFLENIKKMSIDEYSIKLLISKCDNSKTKFFEYMENYYNNRFLYHGTNSKWLGNINKYGLNGIRSFDYQKEISKAISLFESYGIYKTFWGKNYKKGYFSYYITDSIKSAVYYAHQAPEYFSKFCANGYCMKLLKNCDHEAFWRRDYNACLNNVYTLCESIKMAEYDKIFIINLFKKLWKKEVKNNQNPIIFVGQIKTIEKDNNNFSEVKANLDRYSLDQLYDIFTKSSDVHNKRFATIKKDFLFVLQLPNLYQLYKIKQADIPQKKYIINDGIRYYPDIFVENDYHENIYFILDDRDTIQKVCSTIYLIPKNFKYIKGYIDSLYYKQKLEYLLLTNGVDLTDAGKKYLLNNSIGIENICKYYLDLSIQLINIYRGTSNYEDKINLYSCIANNIFYNYYVMKKANKMPSLVDYGYKVSLHYDYDFDNYWNRSNQENNICLDKLDLIIDTIDNILNDLKL